MKIQYSLFPEPPRVCSYHADLVKEFIRVSEMRKNAIFVVGCYGSDVERLMASNIYRAATNFTLTR